MEDLILKYEDTIKKLLKSKEIVEHMETPKWIIEAKIATYREVISDLKEML